MTEKTTAKTDYIGCLGCAVWIFGAILSVYLLTHITTIWHILDRIVK